MISHAKIFRHRRMFKTLTGLSTEGFKQILPSFEEAWEADLDRLIIERCTRKIKRLSTTCEGKKHDKRLADEQALRFPKGSKLWKDTGFQGYEPAGVTTLQAKKKPKGGKLSPEEKEANRRVSKVRVRVEHSIAGVKVFRSVRDIYRNFKAGFEDTLIETACGLHNLRSDFPIEAWLEAA